MDYITASFEEYATSWLAFQRSSAGDSEWEKHSWIVDGWVSWPKECPSDLWKAILLILKQDLTSNEATQLGTGPLESLLAEHYQKFSKLAFDEAKSTETLFVALNHMIPNDEFESDFETRLFSLNQGGARR